MSFDKIMKRYIDDLIGRYPVLSANRSSIVKAAMLLIESVKSEGKILICGNGGSSADADHIVGELMKGFVHPRPLSPEKKEALERFGGAEGLRIGELLQQGIPAISLSTSTALNTAFMNDVDPSLVFAQQVMGLGFKGDVLWAISTSGNSSNIVSAAIAAKSIGLRTFAMTGEKDSRLSGICDVCIQVKESETYIIQELHLPVYHTLCLIIEDYFFVDNNQ